MLAPGGQGPVSFPQGKERAGGGREAHGKLGVVCCLIRFSLPRRERRTPGQRRMALYGSVRPLRPRELSARPAEVRGLELTDVSSL